MQGPGVRLRWISIKGTRPLDIVDRVVLKLKVSVNETNHKNMNIKSKGLTKILVQGQITIQTIRIQDTIKDIIQDTSMDMIHTSNTNLHILHTILHTIHTTMDSSKIQAIIELHLVLVASLQRPIKPQSP